MMHESELLRRYALALTLVPDADAAADIFMESTTEEDLRSRARRWRTSRAIPPEPATEVLPALDDDQRAHAFHLARRAALRRRTRPWLAGAAIAVVVLTVVTAIRLLNWTRPSETSTIADGGRTASVAVSPVAAPEPLTVQARGGRPAMADENSCGRAALVRSSRGEPVLVLTVPYAPSGPVPEIAAASLYGAPVDGGPGKLFVDVRAERANSDDSGCYLVITAVSVPERLQGQQIEFTVKVRPGRMAASSTFSAIGVWAR